MPPTQKRVTGEALKARDALWLEWREEGRTAAEIAEFTGVTRQLVNRRLRIAEAAREAAEAAAEAEEKARLPRAVAPWWLQLVPLFPIGSFTPQSECPHKGRIREGSQLCCMVCSGSGMDHLAALARDESPKAHPSEARTMPAPRRPSPRPSSRAARPTPKPETRRDRRRRLFGEPAPEARP